MQQEYVARGSQRGRQGSSMQSRNDGVALTVLIIIVVLLIIGVLIVIGFAIWGGGKELYFTAMLNGAQEVPPVATMGVGRFEAVLSKDQNVLLYSMRVEDLTSAVSASHFHLALPGQSGPILKTIDLVPIVGEDGVYGTPFGANWSTSDPTQPLTSENVQQLLNGQIYVNVHTQNYPNGEIRGQVQQLLG